MAPPDVEAPIAVGELELAGPEIVLDGAAPRARLLVRARGRPVGWISVDQPVPGAARARAIALAELGLDRVAAAGLRAGPNADPANRAPPESISVVVCTRDRPELLARCLGSLASGATGVEIVVVDSASRGAETKAVAARFGVRYVREDRPGLDRARNRGIRESKGAIIAFTDDDVRVDADWVGALGRAFRDPEISWATGLVAPAELDTRARLLFEDGYGGMGKGYQPIRWDRRDLGAEALIAAHATGVGANMAFRRAVFDAIGAFDEALDVGTPARGGGDLDLFHRALVAGFVGRYEPAALVWHSHRATGPELGRQLADNGRAFVAYLAAQWRAAPVRAGAVSRREIARFTLGRWLPWLLTRPAAGLLGRDPVPARYRLREIFGALGAPFARRARGQSD